MKQVEPTLERITCYCIKYYCPKCNILLNSYPETIKLTLDMLDKNYKPPEESYYQCPKCKEIFLGGKIENV